MAKKLFSGMFGKAKQDDCGVADSERQSTNEATESVETRNEESPAAPPSEDIVAMIKLLDKRVRALEEELKLLKSDDSEQEKGQPTEISPAPFSTDDHAGETARQHDTARTIYLAAPNPDGTFADFSYNEQIGKSIYRLSTNDGTTGRIAVLDTKDATATAVISISQFIKPACKIANSVSGIPSRIITEQEGIATYDGQAWSISQKAVVRLEK